MAIKLQQYVEERTFTITIEAPDPGPYTVKAWRERRIVDEAGKPVLGPDGRPIVVGQRVIERTIEATDPEAVQIAKLVAAKIDKWATE